MEQKSAEELGPMRTKMISLLGDSFPELGQEVVKKLEYGINKYSDESTEHYAILCVKVISNLKNKTVMENITNGTWEPEEFANFKKDTLNPEKWQTLQELRLPKKAKERRKGRLKCPRCKSWYTTDHQLQTRSGDEGMTSRCACDDCGHHWKFG
jgi:DNA-directed RNA polymerase subunit M/transcription elongation factor TFIIS